MKKFLVLLVSVIGVFLVIFIARNNEEKSYLRIHIRANSNSSEDQNVKYKVKDAIVDTLIPVLAEVETFEEAKIKVEENFSLIENVAEQVLVDNGFDYGVAIRLDKENFPTRQYGDLILESGVYDALIIELGSGTGNNWWCLVYPAFCFTSSKNSTNYEYISKIWEIINSIT